MVVRSVPARHPPRSVRAALAAILADLGGTGCAVTGSQYARGGHASLALAAAERQGGAPSSSSWHGGASGAASAGPGGGAAGQALGATGGDAVSPPVTAALLAAVTGALIAWHFAGATMAIALALAVNGIGGAVTVRKVAAHPASEPLASWCWYGTAAVLALPAVGPPGGILYASPAAGLTLTAAVIACARLGGQRPCTSRREGAVAAPAVAVMSVPRPS